jgi:hypothetical protein
MRYVTTIGEREYLIEIIDEHTLLVNGVRYHIDFESVSEQPVYSLLLDGKSFESYVYEGDDALQVLLRGGHYQATVEDEREKRLRSASHGGVAEHAEFHLRAPTISRMRVKIGDSVELKQTLLSVV